jgi:hypothetical protein
VGTYRRRQIYVERRAAVSHFPELGQSCSGPDLEIDQQAISDCYCWAVAEDVAAILRAEDSFAFSRASGFVLPPWDFSAKWIV